MKRIYILCLLTALFSLAASADVRLPDTPKPTPAPKEKKTIDSNLTIRLVEDAKETKLVIPRDQLRQLRAELDALDPDAAPKSAAFFSFSRTQTIASGLFLSLAFVFGGVRFARRKDGRTGKTIAAGAVLFGAATAATIAFANVGPPPELRRISGKLLNQESFRTWKMARGPVKIEITDDAGGLVLIVPEK
jgi:hypothetical protein